MKALVFLGDDSGLARGKGNAILAGATYLLPDSFWNWLGISLLYGLASWAGVILGQIVAAGADILWPANGLLLAFLLRMPRRYWLSYLVGSLIANLAVHEAYFYSFSFAMALLFSVANVVEIALAAYWLTWLEPNGLDLKKLRSLMWFGVYGVVLAPLAAVAFVGGTRFLLGVPSALVPLLNMFIGDAIGIAIMTPLMLAMERPQLTALFGKAKRTETVCILLGAAVLSAVVFWQRDLPIVFLLFPLLLVMMFRLGTSGAAVGVFLIVVPGAYMTALQRGPFAPAATGSITQSVFLFQGFLCVSLVTIYIGSASLTERERLQSELVVAYREVREIAGHDHTTGLANRRAFDSQLTQEWRRAARDKVSLSLLMIDVDHFKLYNDRYGHVAGDVCLRAVASVLESAPLRAGDLVARYGGEEFVVLLPGASVQGAGMMAEVIRQRVIDAALPHIGNLSGLVTISVGVATVHPAEGGSATGLIERADTALYRAKDEGRNQVSVNRDVNQDLDPS